MGTVALKTLGCKLNQYETEAVRAALEEAGLTAVPFEGPADFYVVNTCTVTARSDYKSRQLVRRVCRERPEARVVVTGCYADLRPDDITGLGSNVVVVPNREKGTIPSVLGVVGASPRPAVTRFAGKTRLFLKVQEGCDHVCAYCVVKRARGPSRSRDPGEVIADVEAAVAQGVKEVVLVGVDLGAYGRDLPCPSSLATLVAALDDVAGGFRVRLSSVDVADVAPELVRELAAGGRLCPHIHLPLQSADDGVLAAMRRRYRARDFRRVCDDLFAEIPDVAVGADVIAGLPGEDADAFEATRRFIDETPFAYLHVFPYSARPGTAAAAAPGQVAPAERERRAAVLREIGTAKRRAYERRFDGAVRPTLVEETPENPREGFIGLTDNYLHIALPGYAGPGNRLVTARVALNDKGLAGEVVTGGVT